MGTSAAEVRTALRYAVTVLDRLGGSLDGTPIEVIIVVQGHRILRIITNEATLQD